MESRLGNLRTAVVVALIICITLFIAALGIDRTRHARDALDHLSTSEIERQVLGERWNYETRMNLLRTVALLHAPDSHFAQRLRKSLDGSTLDIEHIEQRLRVLVPEARGQALLDAVDKTAKAYRDRREDVFAAQARGQDISGRVREELEPMSAIYSDSLTSFNYYIDAELIDSQTEATRSAIAVEWTLTVGAFFAIALGLGVVAMSVRAERVRRRADRHMEHLTHHDTLTGLPNRVVLKTRLDSAIEIARQRGSDQRVTVGFIGLDGFKQVNDNLGLPVGDQVLKVVAQRLVSAVRGTDTVVRLGGDEFAILLGGEFPAPAEAHSSLQRIVKSIAEPILAGSHVVHASCSIGLSVFPADGSDGESLLKNANAAMYEAKGTGGNRFEVYHQQMNENSAMRFRLQAALSDAIRNDELYIDYQPQIDLATNRLFGVEALLRWRHPELGLISPATFIPVAEQTGMIVEIGEWVLRTACMQSVVWRQMGLPPIIVAVNVSARQFRNRGFLAQVAAALVDTGAHGAEIELELTESMLMNDVDSAVALMHDLRALGLHLSIDDFGTGYSSLAALQTFPISRLKIDRAFVKCIERADQEQPITSAIIDLGHRLELKVIAEGIETPAQLEFLRRHRCDEVQGFLFSKPVAPTRISDMLRSQTGFPMLGAVTEPSAQAAVPA